MAAFGALLVPTPPIVPDPTSAAGMLVPGGGTTSSHRGNRRELKMLTTLLSCVSLLNLRPTAFLMDTYPSGRTGINAVHLGVS